VTLVGAGVTIFHDIASGYIGDSNRVSVALELGPSFRQISGDITDNDSLRLELLTSNRRHFGGFEGGLEIKFNKVTARMQGYLFMGQKVPGFTAGQVAAVLSVQGDIFQGVLKH
jgi:hypothetical protein